MSLTKSLPSPCNRVYIQPHYPLSDNVISHKITSAQFSEILKQYGDLTSFQKTVVTKYYHEDVVLQVNCDKTTKCYMTSRHSVDVGSGSESSLELVQENVVDLSVMKFPLKNKFHHERQAVLLIQDGLGYSLELEILVPGIKEPRSRLVDLSQIMLFDSPESKDSEEPAAFSLSFRFMIKSSTLDVNKHIARLASCLKTLSPMV
jgi:hypothetical protein